MVAEWGDQGLVQAQEPSCYMSLDKLYHFLGHDLPICEMREAEIKEPQTQTYAGSRQVGWMGEAGQTPFFYIEYLCTSMFHNSSSIYYKYFRLRGNIANPHVHTTQLNKEDFQIQLRFFTPNWAITYMVILSIWHGKCLYLCPLMKPVPKSGWGHFQLPRVLPSPCQAVPLPPR